MVPSLQQTYEAVVLGMNEAMCDPAFGPKMLMGGKVKGNVGKETWLCKGIRDAFENAGFEAKTEAFGRIDIAIVNQSQNVPECAIEAKILYCHDCRQAGKGHYFLKNVQEDIDKRRRRYPGVPLQAIVLAADYQSMCADGRQSGLYHADAIARHLAKHGRRSLDCPPDCCGFIRFERDLFEQFEPTCDIFPRRGKYPPANTWMAEHLGASEHIRA
jgi:hypothetical protein